MLSHERHMEHHQDLEKQFTILSAGEKPEKMVRSICTDGLMQEKRGF